MATACTKTGMHDHLSSLSPATNLNFDTEALINWVISLLSSLLAHNYLTGSATVFHLMWTLALCKWCFCIFLCSIRPLCQSLWRYPLVIIWLNLSAAFIFVLCISDNEVKIKSIKSKPIVIPGILLNVIPASLFMGEREMYLVWAKHSRGVAHA